jgi:hypothetical protein
MMLCSADRFPALAALLERYGLQLERVRAGSAIPGSYWGAPEAGLIGNRIYARPDTPLHSLLHEAAHAVCMDGERRARLHTDAGGDDAEESAVCCLEIVLAQQLGVAARRICADMDAWGYSFRLGSAYAWFTRDAADSRRWLLRHGLITSAGALTWHCRATTIAAIDA